MRTLEQLGGRISELYAERERRDRLPSSWPHNRDPQSEGGVLTNTLAALVSRMHWVWDSFGARLRDAHEEHRAILRVLPRIEAAALDGMVAGLEGLVANAESYLAEYRQGEERRRNLGAAQQRAIREVPQKPKTSEELIAELTARVRQLEENAAAAAKG